VSLARAIETGDLTQLPSRRDEDWRWTDLRGLIRVLPAASPVREERLTIGAGEVREAALEFAAATGGAQVSRLTIQIAENATLRLFERYAGAADSISEVDLEIVLGGGAVLERLVIAADGADAVTVSTARIELGPGARLAQTVLTSGARRQRLETRVSHPGGGASVRLDGVYLLAGKRHADITTVVTHTGMDGSTDQLTKGAVRDQARGVFQGRIVVSRGADKTDARMGHHALIPSDRAEVDAKPELEIYADDVACAHGNTVGALDEEALFYARQRGMGEAEARAMLTRAFLVEVIDRIEDAAVRAIAGDWLVDQLGGPA
jgi:Fe-S cluster assembly protein SufD